MCQPLDLPTERAFDSGRNGLTMVELLLAISLMSIVVTALATLASAVQVSSEFTEGLSDTCQHARVSMDRIQRTVAQAYATETNPGVAVVYWTSDSATFPDSLVVWSPNGNPQNADGPPLVSELVLFCPDLDDPSRLVEIHAPSDTREVELLSLNTPSGRAMLDAIKIAASSEVIELTPLLRVVGVRDAPSADGVSSGLVRFSMEMHPTEAEWENYLVGSTAWEDLPWAQGIYGPSSGMRQVALHYELQLLPPKAPANAAWTVPYFGSAALMYELDK